MNPDRWRKIEEVYHAALERAESQRTAFLDAACAGDSALRDEVESLLAHKDGGNFIESPAMEVAAKQLAQDDSQLRLAEKMEQQRIGSTVSTTASSPSWARAGWGWSTRRKTPRWAARWPSSFCRR